jgi:hypothetical protein
VVFLPGLSLCRGGPSAGVIFLLGLSFCWGVMSAVVVFPLGCLPGSSLFAPQKSCSLPNEIRPLLYTLCLALAGSGSWVWLCLGLDFGGTARGAFWTKGSGSWWVWVCRGGWITLSFCVLKKKVGGGGG